MHGRRSVDRRASRRDGWPTPPEDGAVAGRPRSARLARGRDAMLVTVAVCTWNRARLLDQALAEMERLRIPDGVRWEVVVVDNHCTDDTPAVLARRAERLPLRAVLEPEPGIAHARTRALATAEGELLLFADDDVLVDREWLAAYVAAAAAHPDASFFGGPIEPWFANEPPAWLARNWSVFAGAFALRTDPAVALLKSREHLPFSANLALRRSAYVGRRFDPNLGRRRGVWLGGEETRLLEELVAEGRFGIWVREARVRHHITPDRQTVDYLWDFYHGKGRTRVRRGDPLPSHRRLVRTWWKARLRRWVGAPLRGEKWARALKRAATTRGILDELEASAGADAAP